MFLVIEGIDGTGKSTLTRRLATRIELATGNKSLITHEPSSPQLEKYIRGTFKDTEKPLPSAEDMAVLFTADRLIHMREKIQPALKDGKLVICDRHKLSTLAYQLINGCDPKLLIQLCALPKPNPDFTLLLDMPAELARERMIARKPNLDRYEADTDKQERMRNVYLDNFEQYSEGAIIDASQNEDEVADAATMAIMGYMKRKMQCEG